ncbi:MAG: type 1 glutamine amidotransferase domain-containing protein [Pseudobdellovibrio sp.]
MFHKKLSGKTIAILAADGFEEAELLKPKQTLEEAGAVTKIISINKNPIKSWTEKNWGTYIDVDQIVSEVKADDFDGLLIPGGVMNPDQLRTNKHVIQFAKDFILAGKPVAAICHGPWVLIETGLLDDCTVTSWPSLKTDLVNAGATWLDQEVIVDLGIITSRRPEDIPAFCSKFIEQLLDYIPTSAIKKTTITEVKADSQFEHELLLPHV